MAIEVENGDNLVTLGILPKKRGHRCCANPFFLFPFLVPRDRIELPTRGFSVTASEFPNLLKLLQATEFV